MKIKVGNTFYTTIKSISFAPETDITGDTVPVNDFDAIIVTTDTIRYGDWAYLYDDLDNLWAKYWIAYSEHENRQTVHIKAVSTLMFLEQRKLTAVMYEDGINTVLGDIFGSIPYEVDESLASVIYTEEGGVIEEVMVEGFCPEQSARERLLWLCLTVGAYVKTFFTDKVVLLCLTNDTTSIPIEKTFWKPVQKFRDYVTAIKITYYSYTMGTPQTTDEWVTDGIDYYIQTESVFTLSNSGAPSSAPENIVEVDGVTLINQDNVSDIASFLAAYYFNRTEVDMDVINNAEYMPGQKIVGYLDEESMISGYVQSADFSFGLQARSTLHVLGALSLTGASLTVIYQYGQILLDRKIFYLPVGYAYAISNPYIDRWMEQRRYVYIPDNENATGTVASGGSTNTQTYAIALEMNLENEVLTMYSVDETELVVEEDTEVDPETEEETTIEYNVLEIG